MSQKTHTLFVAAVIALAGIFAAPQTKADPNSPALQEIVKLSKAHVSDDIILSYLKTSTASYQLSADDIIYLNGQGVSQGVIAAIQAKSASNPASAPTSPAPAPQSGLDETTAPADAQPAPEANYDTFHDQLAPYGTWVQTTDNGWCWQPTGAIAQSPDWRPYCDYGHWVYSDEGWVWASDYRWGAIAFHYGRWYFDPVNGWLWMPDYVWGPSWVCWRYSDRYCGWAPLPPRARFDARVGIVFGGRSGAEIDFGLGVGAFTFVAYDHLTDGHDVRHFAVPHDRAAGIFRESHALNDYRVVNGRFINGGVGRERVEHQIGHSLTVIKADDVRRDTLRRTSITHDERSGGRDDRNFGGREAGGVRTPDTYDHRRDGSDSKATVDRSRDGGKASEDRGREGRDSSDHGRDGSDRGNGGNGGNGGNSRGN